ncbi:unnamed protein product [Alopecurus aequalis]
MKRGLQASAVTVLFIGWLIVVGQCRLHAMKSYQDAMHSKSDDSKVKLIFCAARDCKTKDDPWSDKCVCCLVLPDIPCWHSMRQCQVNCRACNPECPSLSPKELHV